MANRFRDIFTSVFGQGGNPLQSGAIFINTIDSASAAGQSITVENATENATVLSCVNVLSQGIAQLPYGVHDVSDGGNEFVPNHPLNTVFNRPNAFQSAYDFKAGIIKDLTIHGNSFTRIVRTASGTVIQLIPINPSDMAVSANQFGLPIYKHDVQGLIEAVDIIHVKGSSGHELVGESPVIRARERIGGLNAADKLISETFQYGVSVNYSINMDGDLDDTKRKRIEQGMKESFGQGGRRRSGAVLLEGGSMTALKGTTPADADLRELRAMLINEIAAVFRVPADMVGGDTSVTYNNVTARLSSFYRDSLQPIICSVEEAFSMALLDDGERLTFDVSALLRGDSASQIAYVAQARAAGVMTVNQAREYLGMGEMDEDEANVLPPMSGAPARDSSTDDETDQGNLGNEGGTQ